MVLEMLMSNKSCASWWVPSTVNPAALNLPVKETAVFSAKMKLDISTLFHSPKAYNSLSPPLLHSPSPTYIFLFFVFLTLFHCEIIWFVPSPFSLQSNFPHSLHVLCTYSLWSWTQEDQCPPLPRPQFYSICTMWVKNSQQTKQFY